MPVLLGWLLVQAAYTLSVGGAVALSELAEARSRYFAARRNAHLCMATFAEFAVP